MSGDPIFALSATYLKDPATEKVNLGVGVYRDDKGQPWILPTVKKVERLLAEDPTVDHEYPPIAGFAPFIESARDLLFGNPDPELTSRISSIQTISGTGACHIGARFLAETLKPRRIWMSDPTWGNHHLIWDLAAGNVEQRLYPYYDGEKCRLDFEGMMSTLEQDASEGDIVLLHACAHNPTGLDPAKEQWVKIADLCERKGLFPFFDSAYQGFASGDADLDAWAVRHFVGRNTMELCCAQSFSKNFGLYGQRVGAFHLVTSSSDASVKALAALADFQRGEISMPPIYGARIVAKVLRDDALRREWQQDLKTMSDRIKGMRKALFDELQDKGTPGTWDHIVNQVGMFSYTGLSEQQVAALQADHHVYMLKSSRASIAGLSTDNVALVARGIDAVVRQSHKASLAKNLEPAIQNKPQEAKVLIEEGDVSAVQA
ncbi:hypothetical protein MBLNU459_g4755t2 [Dothideomycetes sp. NU459]